MVYTALQIITRGRDNGVSVVDLGRQTRYDQKTCFYLVKQLTELDLVCAMLPNFFYIMPTFDEVLRLDEVALALICVCTSISMIGIHPGKRYARKRIEQKRVEERTNRLKILRMMQKALHTRASPRSTLAIFLASPLFVLAWLSCYKHQRIISILPIICS
jgi:hypothetical protein